MTSLIDTFATIDRLRDLRGIDAALSVQEEEAADLLIASVRDETRNDYHLYANRLRLIRDDRRANADARWALLEKLEVVHGKLHERAA